MVMQYHEMGKSVPLWPVECLAVRQGMPAQMYEWYNYILSSRPFWEAQVS